MAAASTSPVERTKGKIIRLMWPDDEGQDLAEYGLLLILIAAALVAGIGLFEEQMIAAFSSATAVLNSTGA